MCCLNVVTLHHEHTPFVYSTSPSVSHAFINQLPIKFLLCVVYNAQFTANVLMLQSEAKLTNICKYTEKNTVLSYLWAQ